MLENCKDVKDVYWTHKYLTMLLNTRFLQLYSFISQEDKGYCSSNENIKKENVQK